MLGGSALLVGLALPVASVAITALAVPVGAALESRYGDLPVGPADVAALLVAGVVAARLATRRQSVLSVPAVAVAVAPFIAVLLLESSLAPSLAAALKATLRWVELAVVSVCAASLVRSRRDVLIAVGAVGASVAGQGLLGAAQFVTRTGPPSFAIGPFLRAYGTFGQPNPYAGYLAMSVPLLVAVAAICWRCLPPLGLVALVTCAGLGAAGVAMSLSRGAWIGLVAAALTVALVWSRRTRLLAGAGIVVLAVTAGASGLGLLPESIQARIAPVLGYVRVFDARGVVPLPDTFALVERMAHWQVAAEMFVDYPLFGVGPGHYAIAYPEYAILPYWRDPLGHAHNVYLNVAAESGVLGLLAFGLMLAVWAAVWVRTVRRSARSGQPLAVAVCLGAGASIIAAMAHNLFDNLFVHGLNVHVGVLLGLLAWSAARVADGRRATAEGEAWAERP